MEPIVFEKKNNTKLFGVLYSPADSPVRRHHAFKPRKLRTEWPPTASYVKMAREVLRSRLSGLRFDREGLGDSEGNIDETVYGGPFRLHTNRPICRGHEHAQWIG